MSATTTDRIPLTHETADAWLAAELDAAGYPAAPVGCATPPEPTDELELDAWLAAMFVAY